MQEYPFTSVIIPVYNDAKRLSLCLEALQKQTYPSDRFEILVVDNGSTDVISSIPLPKNAHLLYEQKPGSYAARNKGITEAQGVVLAFTDSDCIPHESWIESGVQALEAHPHAGFVGGAIQFFFKHEEPNLVELYDSVVYLKQEINIQTGKCAVTANIFISRATIAEIGLFKADLFSGGDIEWTRRVFYSTRQYTPVFTPQAYVLHPARSSTRSILHRTRRIIGGQYVLRGGNTVPLSIHLKQHKRFAMSIMYLLAQQQVSPGLMHRLILLERLNQCVSLIEILRLRLWGKPIR